MLRVEGNEALLEEYAMPSECMARYHRERPEIYEFTHIWVIEKTGHERVAHLVAQENAAEYYQSRASIAPAYKKGNS